MQYTVTTVSGSPNGWRVLLALTLKALPYDVNYLQLSNMEHKSEEYLKLNPRGKVPVLHAGGHFIRDSIAILAWLDRKHSDTPLFGTSADEAREIWQVTMETAEYLRAAFQGVFTPILIRGVSYDEAEASVREQLDAASVILKSELDRLETLLRSGAYMVGDRPSAADCVTFPEVRMMARAIHTKSNDMEALGLDTLERDYPKLSEWSDRVLALPGVIDTMPVHWSS